MNRSDLIQRLAQRFPSLTLADADVVVKALLMAMRDSLAHGQRVEVRGFGAFDVRDRPPRKSRNPRTGESLRVPERRVPYFRSSPLLRERIDPRLAQREEDAGEKPGS